MLRHRFGSSRRYARGPSEIIITFMKGTSDLDFMEDYTERVTFALERAFPNADVDIGWSYGSGPPEVEIIGVPVKDKPLVQDKIQRVVDDLY